MLGAGLVKWGLLEDSKIHLWSKISGVGFAVGIPLTLVGTAIRAVEYERQTNLVYLGNALHDASSLILAAAISMAVFHRCVLGRRNLLRTGLAAVGRTALTNYIGQSVVMSLIATSYGLGLYGDLTHLQLLLLSAVCFLFQMAVSLLWLRHFRMGPAGVGMAMPYILAIAAPARRSVVVGEGQLSWGRRCARFLRTPCCPRKPTAKRF